MSLKLTIPEEQYEIIKFFLGRYKELEWSGPAWFEFKRNKKNFPISWKLKYFEPIHLGDGASTEYTGKVLNNTMLKVKDGNPELEKCTVGMIHSHHTMKAYFSETDKEQLIENANRISFPSLVVSSVSPYAFAISYLDQYEIPHIFENSKIVTNIKVKKYWKDIATKLEQKRKEEVKAERKLWSSNKWKNNKKQTTIYDEFDNYSTLKNYSLDRDIETDGWGNPLKKGYK